jgi:hypothetical protein
MIRLYSFQEILLSPLKRLPQLITAVGPFILSVLLNSSEAQRRRGILATTNCSRWLAFVYLLLFNYIELLKIPTFCKYFPS